MKYAFSFTESFRAIARKAKWKISYDESADLLYWAKANISKNSKLQKISREISFFVDQKGGLDGLMIQSFRNNFLTQNRDVAVIYDLFEKSSKNDILFISDAKEKKAQDLIIGFSESIKKDIYKDALDAGYTSRDLENILTASAR